MTCAFGNYDGRAYVTSWLIKFSLWSVVFWWLRQRSGQVQFVERQIAHVWAANFFVILFVNIVESKLGLPPLSLSPIWAVSCAMTFLLKAAILSGRFYLHTAALLICAGAMLTFPEYSMLVFGMTASSCFFLPGLKFYLKAKRDSLDSPLQAC